MRLWTFQTNPAVDLLKQDGILRKPLKSVEGPRWQLAYKWMMEQMEVKGINCNNFAPIWAWHSCNSFQKGPTLEDASNLLYAFQLEQGVQTIEFECPNDLALVSNYHKWCDILDAFIYGATDYELTPEETEAFYALKERETISYQATLPFLKLEWVKDIRSLPLSYGDDDFDLEALA